MKGGRGDANAVIKCKLCGRENSIDILPDTIARLTSVVEKMYIQGGFFDCSALKMTKCQPLKEISELFLPKND